MTAAACRPAQNLLAGRAERCLFIALGRVQLTRRTMCSNNLRDACCQHNYVPKRPWVLSRAFEVVILYHFLSSFTLRTNWTIGTHTHTHLLTLGAALRAAGAVCVCVSRRATKGEGKIEFLWTAKRGVIKKYHTPRFCLSAMFISLSIYAHLCLFAAAHNGATRHECAQKHKQLQPKQFDVFWDFVLMV